MYTVEAFFGFLDYNSVLAPLVVPPISYILSADNTQDGLQVVAPDVSVILGGRPIPSYRIQMSMVAVGIREYNQLTYPDQIIFPDAFAYNSIEPISNLISGPIQVASG